jgi:hypothetical protein
MPRYTIKLHDSEFNRDYYMEWSTVVDAPITFGCNLEEFTEYYRNEYGRDGMALFEERIKRVEEKGISAFPPFDNLENFLKNNRAGEQEKYLDKEAILSYFCRNQNTIPLLKK